jgi:hypothetical protein
LRPRPGYLVNKAPNASPHTAELFATVRDNGRILDDFRCVVGGNAIFEVQFEKCACPVPTLEEIYVLDTE